MEEINITERDKKLMELLEEAIQNEREMAKAMGVELSREEAKENVADFIETIKKKAQEEK